MAYRDLDAVAWAGTPSRRITEFIGMEPVASVLRRFASAFSRYMSNEAEGIHGQIYFVEDVGVITVEGLPELQAGESYQAWAVIGNQVMSLGALGTTETGDGFVLLSDHVTEDEPVFITVESQEDRVAIEAGSPTGRVVLSTEP